MHAFLEAVAACTAAGAMSVQGKGKYGWQADCNTLDQPPCFDGRQSMTVEINLPKTNSHGSTMPVADESLSSDQRVLLKARDFEFSVPKAQASGGLTVMNFFIT